MCECTPQVWLPHPNYVGFYEVSTRGQVRSLDRVITDRIGRTRWYHGTSLAAGIHNGSGRAAVGLQRAGHIRLRLVHQLVLETFVGPRPLGMDGCHDDGNKLHNCVSNLRWDTAVANAADKKRHGTEWQMNKTRCPRDHLLVAPNVVPSQLPHRICLACSRARSIASLHRRKYGIVLDIQVEADRRYAQIMSAVSVPGRRAVEAS